MADTPTPKPTPTPETKSVLGLDTHGMSAEQVKQLQGFANRMFWTIVIVSGITAMVITAIGAFLIARVKPVKEVVEKVIEGKGGKD